MNEELLSIICCPLTHQKLTAAKKQLVEQVNHDIESGRTTQRDGDKVAEKLDDGLVTEDGQWLYPIRNDIPVLLATHAIPLKKSD